MTSSETLTPAATLQSYLSLKIGSAMKTGSRSQGCLHYRILTDTGLQALYLTLVANDSSGCFSREVVPFERIERSVQDIDVRTPLASKLFQSCFVSKSQNNAGFLAAVLRQEGLLQLAPDSTHQHALLGDWSAWKTAMLALADGAETYRPELPKPRGGGISKATGSATGSSTEPSPDPAGSDSALDHEDRCTAMPVVPSAASSAAEAPELSDAEMDLLQRSGTGDITNQTGDEDSGLEAPLANHRQGKKQRRVKPEPPSLTGDRP